jgi:hypothetical protein
MGPRPTDEESAYMITSQGPADAAEPLIVT